LINFTDKKAIVTGAASGVGRATALLFAELGADVALFDINQEGIEEVANQVRAKGRNAIPLKTDITDFEMVKNSTRAVIDTFGRIDILANVAGWDRIEFFLDNNPDIWNKIIGINLNGTIYCVRAVLEQMVQQDGKPGAIVSVVSDAGRVGASGEAVYSACKGGVIAFTKAIAREIARKGIRVNCVSPGQIETALLDDVRKYNPKYVDAVMKACPFRRAGLPEEMAAAIAFLASEQASFITGQVLSVSGGLTMC
jgi:2-hydroxycyclohexanecarboxyl-CoA dehydrogenase